MRFLVLVVFANVFAFVLTMPAASVPATNDIQARSAAVQCIDGIDNDGDGWIDVDVLRGSGSRPGVPTYYGPDPQCMSQSDNNESPWDPPPAPPPPPPLPPPPPPPAQCIDGIDNDGDGWIDVDVLRGSPQKPGAPNFYGPDPQCMSQSDNDESPWDPPPAPPPPPPPPPPPAQCIDGIDNDGDGWIDVDVLREGRQPGATKSYGSFGPDPQCMSQSDNNESPWDPPPPAPPPMELTYEVGFTYEELDGEGHIQWSQTMDGIPADFYVISTDGGKAGAYTEDQARPLLPDIIGQNSEGRGGDQRSYVRRCHNLRLWKTARDSISPFHPIVWRFRHHKHWCREYPRILPESLSIDSFFSNIDPNFQVVWDDHGSDHWYRWRGSDTGGHYSRRQGRIDNCILRYGCIGSHYPQIQIWVNGNGAFAAEYEGG